MTGRSIIRTQLSIILAECQECIACTYEVIQVKLVKGKSSEHLPVSKTTAGKVILNGVLGEKNNKGEL